jgi:porin
LTQDAPRSGAATNGSRRRSKHGIGCWLALSAALVATAAAAADGPRVQETPAGANRPNAKEVEDARKALEARGVAYTFYYTNDVLANVQGGQRRGAVDQGKLEAVLKVDLEKAAGWQGLSFFANGFAMHNTGRILREYVGGINTIAAIEGEPTVRLSELWLERKLADGKASVRFGQLAADVEFFYSNLSTLFLQSDWATIAASDLPSGGPAYPLSTPGIRVKFDPSPYRSFLIGIFNGDPAGPGASDPQFRNRYGLNFRVTDPALVMGEAQFRSNTEAKDTGLASTLKIGAWAHFGSFDDMRVANDGKLLADPSGSGVAAKRRGNNGFYGIIEQQLYRPSGGSADSGISVYGRISASPSDRNLIDFYVDGGIVVSGMVPGRPDDKFGGGFIYSQFSKGVRDFDGDQIAFGNAAVQRDFEANLELNYQFQMMKNWTLQPNMQFIWHPNGNADRDAMVVGVRSFVQY